LNKFYFIIITALTFSVVLGLSLSVSAQENSIPSWIKNNAKWWSDGQIDDDTFVGGIQFLIKEDIIVIPPTIKASRSSSGIPDWIKNNAKWWSDDRIGDGDFVQGIQFLVSNGIIDVGIDTESKTKYTVLVYMVASDLESQGYAATKDLNEMMQIGSSDSVNVIVESGGSNAIPDDYRQVDFTTVKRLYIEKENISKISDLGQLNMGNSKTLSDFLTWGIKNYPAEKYLLVMWDHGSGIDGFGNDELTGDNLQLDEIEEAFASAREETATDFEIIGFDACLMATVEVASVAYGYSNYLVASEELEPGHGWDYTAILDYITKSPDVDGKAIGKKIADSYLSHSKSISSEQGINQHRMITLSVIDLSKIPSLIDAINALAVSLDDNLTSENYYYFSDALFGSERYGVEEGMDSGHTDIKDVVKNLGINISQVKNQSDKVSQKVTEAVVYSIKGESRPNSNGLSMYQPITEEIENQYDDESQWESTESSYQDYLAEDTVYPEIYAEFQGNSIVGQFSGEDVYSFNLYIASPNQGDIIEIFSTEEYDPYEFPNGEFVIDWDGTIPALCNNDMCSPINLEYEWDDQTILAYVPVFVQASDIETSADLIYDVSSEYPIFIGMWPDDEDESIYQRNIMPLYIDDLIYTYTLDYNTTTGESEYTPYEDDPIRVDENFEFTQASFPGTYQIILEVCDYSDNCAYSEGFEYIVEE
jgi:hypothetical protein